MVPVGLRNNQADNRAWRLRSADRPRKATQTDGEVAVDISNTPCFDGLKDEAISIPNPKLQKRSAHNCEIERVKHHWNLFIDRFVITNQASIVQKTYPLVASVVVYRLGSYQRTVNVLN